MKQQLNITVGSDVLLHVSLTHDGEAIDPTVIEDLSAALISGMGKKTALGVSVESDYIVVSIPWVEGRLPGCYSLKLSGAINSLAWASVGKSLLRYTLGTEPGVDEVTVEGDAYDITMEAGYLYTDSPIKEVAVTVDGGVGTPHGEAEYARKKLTIHLHDIKGVKGDSIIGPVGPQGDSVLVGQGDLPLAHALGGSNTKAMSQEGVSNALVEYNSDVITCTEIKGLKITEEEQHPGTFDVTEESWGYVRYKQVTSGEIYRVNYKDVGTDPNVTRYLGIFMFEDVPTVGSTPTDKLYYNRPLTVNTEFSVNHLYIPRNGYLCIFYQSGSEHNVSLSLNQGIDLKGKIAEDEQAIAALSADITERESAGVPSVQSGRYINTSGTNTKNNGANPSAIYTWTGIDNTKTYYASFKRPNASSSASVALAYYGESGFLGYEYKDTKLVDDDGDNITDYKCTLPSGTNKIIITSYHNIPGALKTDVKISERVTALESRVDTLEEVKILCFGNSFTQDSMGYVPFILAQYGIKVTIGIAAIGGGTLSDHASKLASASNTYSSWFKYEAGASAWPSQQSITVGDIFADEDWDIVTFQQGSLRNYDSYNTYYKNSLIAIAREVASLAQHPVRLGFILTHAARSYNEGTLLKRFVGSVADGIDGIAPNTERVMTEEPFTLLLPYGTAIQNCRTVDALRDVYSSDYCANMLTDGTHLSDGVPCLAANYANAIAILQAFGKGDKSIVGESLRPDYAWCTAKNIPGKTTETEDSGGTKRTFTTYTTTDEQAYLAQLAATFANKYPFEITDLNKYTL